MLELEQHAITGYVRFKNKGRNIVERAIEIQFFNRKPQENDNKPFAAVLKIADNKNPKQVTPFQHPGIKTVGEFFREYCNNRFYPSKEKLEANQPHNISDKFFDTAIIAPEVSKRDYTGDDLESVTIMSLQEELLEKDKEIEVLRRQINNHTTEERVATKTKGKASVSKA